MSCKHECDKAPVFPVPIFNRPGLDTIGYRIGAWAEMRDHMLARLDAAPALAAWTHRLPDDPGIALVESSAIVGDILTFYQNLYANELYLRTAKWRESVADLVRLTGYRLAPGLGGEATFALAVKGDKSVTVPRAFAFKAQIEGQDKPVVFESGKEVVAWPHLSRFHLYRPRYTPAIGAGTREFRIVGTAALKLQPGDRLLAGIAGSGRLEHAETLIVDSTWESFGTTFVRIKGGIAGITAASELKAYKLGASFHHFGHTAPAATIGVSAAGRAVSSATSYTRNLNAATGSLGALQMPLDAENDTLAGGSTLLVEGRTAAGTRYTLVRTVRSTEKRSLAWGPQTGASTVLTLDSTLAVTIGGSANNQADIRTLTLHQTEGEAIALRAAYQDSTATSGTELYFYGTAAEVQALAKRPLLLAGPGAALLSANVVAVQTLAAANAALKLFRRITLDQTVQYAQFAHDAPAVTVYGNLIPATQGKTEAEAALGNGDRRQTFQTFALPKNPLTWFLEPGGTAHAPELEIHVDGPLWRRVDSFFNSGPDDPVYIVREDDKGDSFVQFGDGKTGARLPSGLNNVVAKWRTGIGAHGPLKPDTKAQAGGQLVGLDQVFMPAPAVGGAQPEEESGARAAAPGRMQSLGRLVSLADYEAEALALPGVLKARAVWAAPGGTPLVQLTILTASEYPLDAAKTADTLRAIARTRGPARFALTVVQGQRRPVSLDITAAFDPARREEDIRTAIKQALGMSDEEGNGIAGDDGLFSLKHRQFGQPAHISQIVAAVQQVPGVAWVKPNAAQIAGTGAPALFKLLTCPDGFILALDSAHLTLNLSKPEATPT